MWPKFLILHLLILSTTAQAHYFVARIDQAVWHLEPSPLQCRLWQSVPNYGDAVFETKAGRSLTFYIEAYQPITQTGLAQLKFTAPEWRSGLDSRDFGEAKLQPGRRPIELSADLANEMLAELQVGMMPSITHPGWYDQHPVTVGVSAVSFQGAYRDYVACLASLYPTNFEELQRSFLHFETNKYGIKGELKARLDLIAGYLAVDPSVRKVYVDGHTDSDGRRGHNWELSRLRAKAVKDYLENQGVFPDMIVMNYHGEGRPIRKNNNLSNKAVNRRVRVSLSR